MLEPVPGRPALDDLLREAGIAWVWDDTGDSGKGVYRPQYQAPDARHQRRNGWRRDHDQGFRT